MTSLPSIPEADQDIPIFHPSIPFALVVIRAQSLAACGQPVTGLEALWEVVSGCSSSPPTESPSNVSHSAKHASTKCGLRKDAMTLQPLRDGAVESLTCLA